MSETSLNRQRPSARHERTGPGTGALEPDALHRETQRRLSTGANAHNQPLMLEHGYTNLGQLDHLTLRGASEQQYQYDALGRMSFRNIEGDQASKVIAYSYDAAGRLIGSQHGDNAHRYSMDAAGNRLGQQQTLPDLGEANSHARDCGGLSKFECFMQNEATPDLGAQMGENLRN